jgi:geranylgeranyl pyrophosphate synthase
VQRQVREHLRDSGVLREVVRRIEQQCALALSRLEQAQPVQRAAEILRDLVQSASFLEAR